MKYLRPDTLAEAVELLADRVDPGTVLLAGGTDLMPRFEQGLPFPERLIDIKHLPEIQGIRANEGEVEIGALTTMEQLRRSDLVRKRFAALARAADDFAAVQIRHRATIGGNLVNASPAGDTLPPLIALDARVRLVGPGGERVVAVRDFFTGPGKTVLHENEVLHSVLLPDEDLRTVFVKLGLRRSMAISVVNFAVACRCNSDGFTSLRIAAGAVAPTVVRLEHLEDALLENPGEIEAAVELVERAIAPIDDVRATARYRRMALKNLLVHTLKQLREGDHE